MAVVRCNQGHYYDDEKFSRCPHCGIFAGVGLLVQEGLHKSAYQLHYRMHRTLLCRHRGQILSVEI